MAKENPQQFLDSCECSTCQQHPQSALAREHRRINRLVAAIDERARRLLVGFLARQHGRGGITLLARITGLDRHTIARGQHELQRLGRQQSGRVRRSAPDAPALKKKSRASDHLGGTAPRFDRRRPDLRAEVDASIAA